MTCEEFSNEFDILYNNVMSNQAPGLDEYEKSVFLTRAQDDIVKRYFTPKGNKDLEGFDTSIKRNIDFSSLYRVLKLNSVLAYNWDIDVLKAEIRNIILGITVQSTNKGDLKTNFDKDISSYYLEPMSDHKICWICFSKPDIKKMFKEFPIKEEDIIISSNSIGFHIEPAFSDSSEYDFETMISLSDNATKYIEDMAYNVTHNKGTTQFNITNIDIKNKTEFPLNPDDSSPIFLPINDSLLVHDEVFNKDRILQIIHLNTTEYMRLMSKPFKQPLKNQAWKLQTNTIDNCASIEVIFGNNNLFKEYTLRYLTRPTPIILTSLKSMGLSINEYTGGINESTPTKGNSTTGLTCLLNKELHPEILQRAVELAKAAYTGDLSSTIQIGNASSTNLGQGVDPQQIQRAR